MRKAQAAMEFLMTYGFSILVFLITIASLAYFGVLRTDYLLPTSCTLEPGIVCIDKRVTNRSVLLVLNNGKGEDITITNIKAPGCTGTAGGFLGNGVQRSFSIGGCDNDGNRYSLDINVSYNSPSGITHMIQGTLTGKIGDSVATPQTLSFRDDGTSINTTYDTMISADNPKTNYGNAFFVNVDGADPHVHGLLVFPNIIGNDDNQIPPGAQIDAATVSIFCYNDGGTMNVYRLVESWTESEATWNNRNSGTPWSLAGAENASHTPQVIAWNCPTPASYNYNIREFIQEWANGVPNYGVVIIDTNPNGNDFTSSEDPILTEKPMLTVAFTVFS